MPSRAFSLGARQSHTLNSQPAKRAADTEKGHLNGKSHKSMCSHVTLSPSGQGRTRIRCVCVSLRSGVGWWWWWRKEGRHSFSVQRGMGGRESASLPFPSGRGGGVSLSSSSGRGREERLSSLPLARGEVFLLSFRTRGERGSLLGRRRSVSPLQRAERGGVSPLPPAGGRRPQRLDCSKCSQMSVTN